MEIVRTNEDLMEHMSNMNKEHSVCQVFIPGIGLFTLVLQEEDNRNNTPEIQSNPSLEHKVIESKEAGHAMSATENKRNPFL